MRRLCAVLFVLALAAAGAAAPVRQVQWQWSESPSVRIGVRDKNDDLHGYEADFVVTSERTGRRWQKKIRVEGDHFGYLNFPDDFAAYDWATNAPRASPPSAVWASPRTWRTPSSSSAPSARATSPAPS